MAKVLKIQRRIWGREGAVKKLLANYESRSFRTFIKKIGVYATLVESKHWGDHNFNVGCLTFAIAEAAGVPLQMCDRYGFAAMLHDQGKLDPFLEHLFAPGKGRYTPEEEQLAAQHTDAGIELFKELREKLRPIEVFRERAPMLFDESMLHLVRDCQRFHDRPYSQGGKRIPEIGRICRIADAYMAMTEKHPSRVYRKKRRTPTEARMELLRCSGTDFDPDLVKIFLDKVLTSTSRGSSGKGNKGKKKGGKTNLVLVSSTGKKYSTQPMATC